MKNLITQKERKELMTKMTMIFAEKLQDLSTELQEILIDDMVTAFENRLKVLNCTTVLGVLDANECIKTLISNT